MDQLKTFISAILLESQQYGSNGLPVTFLIKFMYLLDVYYAEETNGESLTNIDWIFYHFGPYSEQIQSTLDTCVKDRFLIKEPLEDKDFDLYRLGPTVQAAPLEGSGLPFHVTSNLKNAIKKYRYDLSGLLNYVYFQTKPMEDAIPHDALSFGECQKVKIEDVKSIPLKTLSHKKSKRIRELFATMREDYFNETAPAQFETPPIYDDTFFDAVRNEFDEIEIDEKVHAKVSFSKNAG